MYSRYFKVAKVIKYPILQTTFPLTIFVFQYFCSMMYLSPFFRVITLPVLPSPPPVPRVPSTNSGTRYDLKRPRWLSLSKPPAPNKKGRHYVTSLR